MKHALPMKNALAFSALLVMTGVLAYSISGTAAIADKTKEKAGFPAPIDPQTVQDQDRMTWADYRPLPGVDWTAPDLKPERGFRLAVVAVDFPDQPFVITLPGRSDPFGNPQAGPIPREKVPRFYADFFTRSIPENHGHSIHSYWMEQSRGGFGVTQVDAFGPYRMPKPHWFYGLNEYGQNDSTPDGSRAEGRLERDCDELWAAAVGRDVRKNYDAVLRIYAGYDETGVWMEFGVMKFKSREDIPAEWGNPNPEKPRWAPTRYVEWTSWLAGSQQWGLSSMRQGENSGTIAHELGHFAFRLPDLNNNPYVTPYRRAAAGTWDLMDRGCFNGPGGPHMRWVVPPVMGAAMPPGLMIRNRQACGFIKPGELLELSRTGLTASGLVAARVTARAVDPPPGTFTGMTVRLDGEEPGDKTPADDPAANPLSPGIPNYNFYSLEVVQRVGFDSFCPDSGVLLAKNKDNLRGRNGGPNEFNSYIWVIDAHPEDINEVDYVSPNGEKVMRTIADYRQLNDALFHAGLDSGSRFEYIDAPNRLHFYVVDVHPDKKGILSYTLAVRSLDGSGPHRRGVALAGPEDRKLTVGSTSSLDFILKNTGQAAPVERSLHPSEVSTLANGDVYRLEVRVEGKGWQAKLLNALAVVDFGREKTIPVFVRADRGSSRQARLILKAVSESDPSKTAAAEARLSR